jgi:hypothetical protein
MAAIGAAGTRLNKRQTPGQTVNDYVEKASENETKTKGRKSHDSSHTKPFLP